MRAKQLELLFADAAAKLGLEGAQLDENNSCTIVSQYEGVPAVNVRYDAENDIADLYSEIGLVAEEDKDLYRELLTDNFFGTGTRGAVFSLAPDSGVLVLSRELRVASLDADELAAALANLMDVALEARRRLYQRAESLPEDDPSAEDEVFNPPPPEPRFEA